MLDLAQHVTQSATSVSQAVTLIHTHLLANYRYNLDVPSLQSAHPLEDFLLTRKTGYCEHYATAMVVLAPRHRHSGSTGHGIPCD
ncbi:MAG: transglutaminase domain-containing protein [Nitrospira sp.]|nr:transglutaminase domain-containing protein [Nitrospira sp.]